jgi:hypothetical protein
MDALIGLAPAVEQYVSLPIQQALTWADCAHEMPAGEWYLVAFRSVQRAGADVDRLRAYDDLAHAESEGADGFVHYYKGPIAADRSCLSFCLWNSRADARAAAARPAHREAVSILAEMYESYSLEFLQVRKHDSVAVLEFEPYDSRPDTPAQRGSTPPLIGLRLAPS